MMWYLAILVPADQESAAKAITGTLWPDDPGDGNQFTIRLIDASGVQWRGGNIAVTDTELESLAALTALPNARCYRYSQDGVLVEAVPEGPSPGSAWGWAQTLAASGLSPEAGITGGASE